MSDQLMWSTDGIAIAVEFDRFDALQHDRNIWTWRIFETRRDLGTNVPVELLAEGTDLTTVSAFPEAADALKSLGSFLGAWVEAQRYDGSENRDLFPASLLERVDVGTWGDIADRIAMTMEPAS